MTSKEYQTDPTIFHNIQVTAIPSKDPVTGHITYTTTFDPETVVVVSHDAVLNYQLIPPTPDGVQFKDVKIKQKTDQMSTPSIGLSGKVVTFSDANTSKENINLTFRFVDKDGIDFFVDPVVENEPPA